MIAPFTATSPSSVRNIVVLGGSYGGLRAARILAELLEDNPHYRVIIIDRNSHMNHLYVLPRFSIVPGHESKAFIPYTRIFTKGVDRHLVVQGTITSIAAHSVTIERPPSHGCSDPSATRETIPFDYAIYALGSLLPDPINTWVSLCSHQTGGTTRVASTTTVSAAGSSEHGRTQKHWNVDSLQCADSNVCRIDGSKLSAAAWLSLAQKRIVKARSVLVVGGGALGIQIASDTAEHHPDKAVTLLHSRRQLLSLYPEEMHNEVQRSLRSLNVRMILGDRLDLESAKHPVRDYNGLKVIRTLKGRELRADLVLLCTGLVPNTKLLAQGLGEKVIEPSSGLARVLPTLQVANSPVRHPRLSPVVEADGSADPIEPTVHTPFPHIFAIGDAADAFGAMKAGHTAYFQGELAARNVFKLIRGEPEDSLETYSPGVPMIKVSVGLKRSVTAHNSTIIVKDDAKEDLDVSLMWNMLGFQGEFDMEQ